MTLIIGFKCTHGVALVSDTKITGTTSSIDMASAEEERYASKILKPMPNNPFIVGAAGYTDLFREFNNKIPQLVGGKVAQFKIANCEALMRIGYTQEQALQYLSQPVTPLAPYVYTYELFMDDCKLLIKNISVQRKQQSPNPLEVLIGVKKAANNPSLHYIDSDGLEQEVETCTAIGSGSPYVKQYFSRLYSFDKGMYELVTLAFFAIAYAQRIAREKSVGYSQEYPPEAYAVFNDGRCQSLPFTNIVNSLSQIESDVRQFEDIINHTNLAILQSTVALPTELVIQVPRLS